MLKVNIRDKRWEELPKRDITAENDTYAQELKRIKEVLEGCGLSAFPAKLLNEKLEDVSFNEIKIGEFTLFNAFFLDDYYTRT